MNYFYIFFSVVAVLEASFIVKDECGPNEEYLLCGSACPFNCTDPDGPVTCSEECIEGCFCKTGYLRSENGSCVSEDQCIGGNQPACSENEEFLTCGSACPLTCAQPTEPMFCSLGCKMGCFCKSGFVRDDESNRCVTLDNCPTEPCLSQNEVYDMCNAQCEPSCMDPEPICTKMCAGGCVCASGLLRDENGECVSVEKCSRNATNPALLNKYLNVINKILHLSVV